MSSPPKKVTFRSTGELPLTAMSLTGTEANRTGSWKYLEPEYQDITPPCSHRCYLGGDVVAMMRAVEEDRWADAVKLALQVNPFPSFTGRLCPAPCEKPCNRKALGGGIAVHSVETAVGDYKLMNRVRAAMPPVEHPLVHVVGSGPAGLSAAYALRKLGHDVVIHEAEAEPGGKLRYGIPAYRLPVWVLKAEIAWLRRQGIKFELEQRIAPSDLSKLGPTLLCFGFGKPRRLGILGEDLPGVYEGLGIIREARNGRTLSLGETVAVIGGGHTAIDVARTLLRFGSQPVIYYRRTDREMPAFRDDVRRAADEGVRFRYLTTPVRIEKFDHRLRITMAETTLREPDETGRGRPERVLDSEFSVVADAVVKAIGLGVAPRHADEGAGNGRAAPRSAYPRGRHGHWRTNLPEVFSCGERTSTPGLSVSEAIRNGRDAAHALHESVTGKKAPPYRPLEAKGVAPEIAKYKDLNTAYFERAEGVGPVLLPLELRRRSFEAVESPLTESEAKHEAGRCFKCGTCVDCQTCLYFCPDLAIHRTEDGRYFVDMEYCKGCGVCVQECPRHAVHLRRSS